MHEHQSPNNKTNKHKREYLLFPPKTHKILSKLLWQKEKKDLENPHTQKKNLKKYRKK